MPNPTRITAPVEGWNQNKQRSPAIFYDQHRDTNYTAPDGSKPFMNGRPWWCYVERPSDGASMPQPVGPVMPLGWDAPWFPDDKYINRSVGKVTADGRWITKGSGLQEQRFRIDYQAMMADYTTEMRGYYRKAVLEAAGQRMTAPQYGGAIEYALRQIIGNPPKSPKIPEAALAGNKWLLGLQQPIFDERTQRWVVEEDEQLARLLSFGEIELLTPQESATKSMNDIETIRAEFEAFKKKMMSQNGPPDVAPVRVKTGPINPGHQRYTAFIAGQIADGKSRNEANAAWRKHKKANPIPAEMAGA
jgi:hypothetical protein